MQPLRWHPVAIVIVLSVVLRLAAALYQGSDIVARLGVTDEVSYHTLAVRVTEGHGFSFGTGWWPATRANQPTAHWSFLYVLLLAGIYSIAGPAPLLARLIQAVLVGVLHPWLAWRIGNRVFGQAVGVTAAAIVAVYAYFVYYAGALVTESLYIVACLWVLDIATAMVLSRASWRAGRIAPWLYLGVAASLATLFRQIFLLVFPIVLAWMAWHLLRPRGAGAARPISPRLLAVRFAVTIAVIAAAIVPWTVRNYRAFGQFVPLNTNAGFVMFWANHPVHGTSFIPIIPNGPVNYGTLLPADLEPRRLNEAALDRELLRRGIGFVKDDPVRYLRLSASRAEEYFKFWPSADSTRASNAARVLSFGLLLPLLVGGAAITFTRGHERSHERAGAMLLLLVALGYTLLHLVTWTLVRYRLPVDAVLMPLAGVSLVAAWARAPLRRGAAPLRAPSVEAN